MLESLRRTRVLRDPQDPLSSSDEFVKDLDSPQRINLCQLLEPNRTNLTRRSKVLPVPQTICIYFTSLTDTDVLGVLAEDNHTYFIIR